MFDENQNFIYIFIKMLKIVNTKLVLFKNQKLLIYLEVELKN